MCNLTFFYNGGNSISPYKRKIIQLLLMNSIANPDGYGIFMHNFKKPFTYKVPVRGLGSLNKNYSELSFNGDWIFGHVRKASSGNKLPIKTQEDYKEKLLETHPFIEENLLLMHNGTLHFKHGKVPFGTHDSKFLAKKLAEYIKKETLEKSLEIFMNEFVEYGAYCLLISVLEKGKWVPYIIRGYYRELYYIEENGKIIVNTCKETLDMFAFNMSMEKEPSILDQGIYRVIENKLVKVGEVPDIAQYSNKSTNWNNKGYTQVYTPQRVIPKKNNTVVNTSKLSLKEGLDILRQMSAKQFFDFIYHCAEFSEEEIIELFNNDKFLSALEGFLK